MARIIEGPSEPKATHWVRPIFITYNGTNYPINNFIGTKVLVIACCCSYMWTMIEVVEGDNPYYPFSRLIGVKLLWSKVSEKSPYSNNIFEDAWDLPQIPHYVHLKFLVQPPFEHLFLTYVNLHLCKHDIP